MKKIALAEVKDHLSEYLHDAAREQIVITRHGKPAGVLVGCSTARFGSARWSLPIDAHMTKHEMACSA
jgi:prevent-host-death family protein